VYLTSMIAATVAWLWLILEGLEWVLGF